MKEEQKQSIIGSLLIVVPATVVLFIVVLFFPAVTSAIIGRGYVAAVWDLGFGLLWWVSDIFSGKIEGPVAGVAFLIWPFIFATAIMMVVCRLFVRGSNNIRIVVFILILASMLILVPIDYSNGSVFQMLPFWHKYIFLTF